MPWGGARGQSLGHIRIFSFFYAFIFSIMESFVFEQKVLFIRVEFLSVTSDYRVQCPRVGLGFKI